MKIKVLADNNTFTDKYLLGEPAVSYYIEADGKKILFDLGYSDVFSRNAEKMQVDLLDIGVIVLSHGHNDHTWGLKHLTAFHSSNVLRGDKVKKPDMIAHPLVFCRRVDQGEEIGMDLSLDTVRDKFNHRLTKEPYWISENLVFLGEIDRKNDFEGRNTVGKVYINGTPVDDFVLDDSALAYKSSKGLIIITGCSHSGICNIIEYAKKICDDSRIIDIVGGLHLLNPEKNQLECTLEYLKRNGIKEIHACHCTDLQSKIKLSQVVELKETGVGLEIEYE